MKNKKVLPKEGSVVKRSFAIEDLVAAESGSVIEGHPAVYDQKTNIGGYFYEVIERGAFDRCNFDDVLFSVNHELEKIPLARSRRNNSNSTMQITIDEVGLFFRANLDLENNTESRNLYSAVKRQDINGMSFIFRVKKDEWSDLDSDMPTRRIKEISQVIEVSAVTFPAYAGTDIDARDQGALDNALRALDNARSELDNSRAKQLQIEKAKFELRKRGNEHE